MATPPATPQRRHAPELILGWLWLGSVVGAGLLGGGYAAMTSPISVSAALLLLPFLHVVVSIPVFLLFLFGVLLMRGTYARRRAAAGTVGAADAADTTGAAGTTGAEPANEPPPPHRGPAWLLITGWSTGLALAMWGLTAFRFLSVLSPTSAAITWMACMAWAWLLRAELLAYLTAQSDRLGMSWVDRRYAQVHGELRELPSPRHQSRSAGKR